MNKKPRIAFVIPIASARVIGDWNLGCKYLQQTLASIFNSTNGNFRVVVAGHEKPDFSLPVDPRFKFLSLSHPISKKELITYDDKVRDKLIKVDAAWNYAKETWDPDYVMQVDWDDFISSRLVEWLIKSENNPGYRITKGWRWPNKSRFLIHIMDKFDQLCGSSLIIRKDIADLTGPFNVINDSVRKHVKDHCSVVPEALKSTILCNNQHHRAQAYFSYLGYELSEVSFQAAIYRTNNIISLSKAGRGDNKVHSMCWVIGYIRRTRFINRTLKKEFSLP
jgi:hypothetical protein